MSRTIILFGGADYEATTEMTVRAAPLLGADRVLVYDDVWLMAQPFYEVNRWIFETSWRRGFGWFSWKPFLLLDALDRCFEPSDVVLYVDADTRPIDDLRPIFEVAERDGAMFFAGTPHRQREFCKRDCFAVMAQDAPEDVEGPAGCASYVAVTGRWRPRQLLLEWLTYSLNPRANIISPSVLAPEFPGFREHRAEQAILTNLARKHGYRLHRQPDQAGEGFPEDRELYPQLFVQVHSTKFPRPPQGSRFRNV